MEYNIYNILLIYPKFPDTFWSFKYALPFIGKKAAFPPLGLLTVAALLPKKYMKRLVDLNIEYLSSDALGWADIVFISAMSIQQASTVEVIKRCKEQNIKVVAGGPLFNTEPDKFEGEVDHLLLGEAEGILPAFINDLENEFPKKKYMSNEYPNIEKTPIPLWDLVKIKRYASLSIQYSRGCPFNCEFCNITALYGRVPRVKTVQQVVKELDAIYRMGWRGRIFFVDDNFIGNKRIIKESLIPTLIKWRSDKKGCVFYTEASINIADDKELMKMMVEAGFESVFIGIETPNKTSLVECCKTQNSDRDMLKDVKKIHQAGLQVMGGFIVGFDSDPPSIFKRQVDFIQKSGIVTAMVGILQAPPGTLLFKRLTQEKRIHKVFTGDNVDGCTNIIPVMGIEKLTDGYRFIMREIYLPSNYYQRIKRMFKELKEPKETLPIDIRQLVAFLIACLRLGILEKERVHFWRLLIWVLAHKPSLFSMAVTRAIFGYHYRKVCELQKF